MLSYILENKTFILLLLVWTVAGAISGMLALPVILLGMFLFWRGGLTINLLLAFWFMLILSDSLAESLEFAKTAKHYLMVVFAAIFLLNFRKFTPDLRLIKILLPFFLIAVIGMLYSPDIIISAQKTLSYFLLYLCIPAYILMAYREEGPEAFRSMIYFGGLILITGILLKYLAPEVGNLNERFRGIFGNPNGVGVFVLMLFLMFHVVKDIFPDLFSRREILFFYLLCGLNIYWSGSRNALISVMIFIIFLRLHKIAPAIGFSLFLVGVVIYQVISQNLVDIIIWLNLEEYFRVQTLDTVSGRYIAWSFAWEKLQEFFFFGRGFANDELTMRPNYNLLAKLGHQGGVHNSYISLWMDTGLLGILAYFIPFLYIFFRAARGSKVALPVLYAVLFTMIFESWLVGSQNPITIQLVIILTLFYIILPLTKAGELPVQPLYEQAESNIRGIPRKSVA